MKNVKNLLFVLAVFLSSTMVSNAQTNAAGILDAGAADASKYLESYMEPAFVGIGFGLQAGWYNTAKPHSFLGFDLTITGAAVQIPTANEFFTFRNSDYDNINYAGGTSVEVPTLLGPNLGADDLPELTFLNEDGEEIIRLSAPTGLGLDEVFPINAVPNPIIQVGIGLFKGTELKVRFVPESTVESLLGKEDGNGIKYSVFGLGVVHDIKQWFPAEKVIPVDIAFFAGYTSMKASAALEPDNASSDQFTEFEATSVTLQGIVSKKVAFATFYAGLGYANSKVDFALRGTYDTETSVLVDPIAFGYDNSGFRTNLGVRLQLLFLTLSGEYAIQEYNTISASIGFSFN